MRLSSLGRLDRLAHSRWRPVRFLARLASAVVVRTTVAATLAVGIALAASLVSTVIVLRAALTRGMVDTARSEAYDIALLVRDGNVSHPLPLPRGDLAAQVVASSGQVIAATANLRGMGPLVNPRVIPTQGLIRTQVTAKARLLVVAPTADQRTVLLAQPIVLTSRAAATLARSAMPAQVSSDSVETYYVVTIASLASVDQATRTLVHIFDVVYPIVLLIVGVATWWLAHRALAPVDQMITDVAEITSSNLRQRVTQPPGNDEVARLARTMNAMLARLDRAMQREKQFIEDASHELKSPLSAIRTTLEVGSLHPELTDWTETTRIALAESERMQRLIDNLLLLTRTDAGLVRHQRTVDLTAIVAAELERLSRLAPHIDIGDASTVTASIVAEPEQLRSLIRNLAENAARHARHRVVIHVDAGQPGALLVVDDDGPGIPMERREEIFERFARLDEARSRHDGGSGLGLAIVRSVVTGLGGRVWVAESSLGGARFVVSLPTASVAPYPRNLIATNQAKE